MHSCVASGRFQVLSKGGGGARPWRELLQYSAGPSLPDHLGLSTPAQASGGSSSLLRHLALRLEHFLAYVILGKDQILWLLHFLICKMGAIMVFLS